MTEIWIDAQLSPSLAAWINRTYDAIEAKSVRALGLQDAGNFNSVKLSSIRVMAFVPPQNRSQAALKKSVSRRA